MRIPSCYVMSWCNIVLLTILYCLTITYATTGHEANELNLIYKIYMTFIIMCILIYLYRIACSISVVEYISD